MEKTLNTLVDDIVFIERTGSLSLLTEHPDQAFVKSLSAEVHNITSSINAVIKAFDSAALFGGGPAVDGLPR